MSALSQVKAEVKAWERAFKQQHKRDPNKEDIKADSGGIAAKYSSYRALSKAVQKNGSDLSQRYSGFSSKPQPQQPSQPIPGPSSQPRDLKRSASQASLPHDPPSTPPGPSSLLRTPVKPKPRYESASSALRNPFLSPAAPSRKTPSHGYTDDIRDPNPPTSFSKSPNSSFVYASSPARLKSLLAANSLQKQSPTKEVTPRTRARKRLRGEEVDDTPGKPGVRRRESRNAMSSDGERPGGFSRVNPRSSGRGISEESDVEMEDVSHPAMEEEGDTVGPTPVKNGGRKFVSLFDKELKAEQERSFSPVEGEVSPAKGMALFAGKGKERKGSLISKFEKAATTPINPDSSSSLILPSSSIISPSSPDPPSPSALPLLPPSTPPPPPSTDPALARTLELSSAEDDSQADDDGEDHRVRRVRRVRVESYRVGGEERALRRFGGQGGKGKGKVGGMDDEADAGPSGGGESMHDDQPHPPTLTNLSLLSPSSNHLKRTTALAASRAKAIFDSKEAAKLKAAKRAAVWLPGEEADADGEEGEGGEGGEGDWESEEEGWKRDGMGEEEDW